MKDARIKALQAIADPQDRARQATALAHSSADLLTDARALRNHAALCAVLPLGSHVRQTDMLDVMGITRRAWKVIDRRWARETTPCSRCRVSAGVGCKNVPGPREAIHPERYARHLKQIDDAAKTMADPVAVASEHAGVVVGLEEVEFEALAVRREALDAMSALRDATGAPVYQPSDLAKAAGVTTSRIGHMGYRAARQTADA